MIPGSIEADGSGTAVHDRTAEAHFEIALSSIANAVIMTNRDGEIWYMNAAAEDATAWPSSAATGRQLARAFNAVDDLSGQPIDSVVECVRKSGQKYGRSDHVAILNKRGQRVPIEFTASPVKDKQGELIGVVLVFLDLRGRRAAELALQTSEDSRVENADALFEERERAQVTLNSIGDAVISTNFWGRVTYLNIVAERMTGWTQAEASGRALDDILRLVDTDTRVTVDTPPAIAIIENKTVRLAPDCMLIRRDGIEIAIEASASPIHDRQGGVVGAVMVAHDVTVARDLSRKLARLALHDSLTDLPNRSLLKDRLEQAMVRSRRSGHSVALLFVDLDRFKDINDSLGHSVGDRLLQSVAQRLQSCVRTSDTVSRQGGDEFLVLLADVSHPHDAVACADKILGALRDVHHVGGHSLTLTASIGIATFPQDAGDADILLRYSDAAMYKAKSDGKDTYRVFDGTLPARSVVQDKADKSSP